MKLFRALLCSTIALSLGAIAEVNPQLHQVKRVYILAMGSGMDQFLANQLTKAGIFEVVTDPKKADAILSDNVGEPFQQKLDELYPPPPVPIKVEATKPALDASTPVDTKDAKSPDARAGGNNKFEDLGGAVARTSSFGRGKGNFFLVDRKSRIVLWSVYERPKDATPRELTKTAAKVVKQLKDDLTGKKPAE